MVYFVVFVSSFSSSYSSSRQCRFCFPLLFVFPSLFLFSLLLPLSYRSFVPRFSSSSSPIPSSTLSFTFYFLLLFLFCWTIFLSFSSFFVLLLFRHYSRQILLNLCSCDSSFILASPAYIPAIFLLYSYYSALFTPTPSFSSLFAS